jgi:para-aminobenzoate synthetase component I
MTYLVADGSMFRKKALSWAESYSPITAFLDSNGYGGSHYSCLLAAGAVSVLEPASEALEALQRYCDNTPDWLFGFLTYELKDEIESLSSSNHDGVEMPLLHFFRPELVFHIGEKEVAVEYLEERTPPGRIQEILHEILAQEVPVRPFLPLRMQARVGKDEYLETIGQIRKHIERGDIYEMNYCQEFYAEDVSIDPVGVYNSLNEISPTPFSCYYSLSGKYLFSASPERFLRREGEVLLSQPIKGTIRRGATPEEDGKLKEELRNSAKEQSENVMIVDLVRNDLSRIALPGTVKVEELYGIYTFRQVHQMVSSIQCRTDRSTELKDLLKALFPMGSMTGAPKVSAMKLIERFEATRRGLYSGAVGYINPDRDFDFNVVIRSLLYNKEKGYLSFMTGSAITYNSVAEEEYGECLLKAQALLKVLNAELISAQP